MAQIVLASPQERAGHALSLAALASSLMEKHSQDSNQASLTLAVLEIKGLRPRKGDKPNPEPDP